MVKMAVFDLLKSAKIDFTKNLSTVENPQSKFSIRLHWSVLEIIIADFIEACMMDGMQLAQKHL